MSNLGKPTLTGDLIIWDGYKYVSTKIANANVATNAAIAGTKISPDFGSQHVVTTGDGYFTNVRTTGDGYFTNLNLTGLSASQYVKTNGSSKLVSSATLSVEDLRIASQATGDLIYASSATSWARIPVSSDGYVLTLSSGVPTWVAGANSFVAGDDLAGTSTSQQVVGLTGISGVVSFGDAVTTPTINQSAVTTNSATGQTLAIQAQNATGTTSTGGALSLKSGTGTLTAGSVNIATGNTVQIQVSPTSSTFTNQITANNGVTVASGALDIAGSLHLSNFIYLTDTDTLTNDNFVVFVDTDVNNGAITVNLPQGSVDGKCYIIKDATGSSPTYNITINPYSTETIEGQLTYVIATSYQSVTIVWYGAQWYII